MSDFKLAIIGYASHFNHPNIPLLQASLKRWGWPEMKLYGGLNIYPGHQVKLQYLKQNLPLLRNEGYTHFIALDVFDTLCFAEPHEEFISNKWEGLMISCEMACWPDPTLESKYPERNRQCPHPWKHVNSGGLYGKIDMVIDLIHKYPIELQWDDQLYWTKVYLAEQSLHGDRHCKVLTDLHGFLFQTTGHANPWVNFFSPWDDGRIKCKLTNQFAPFYHANGTSEMGWLVEHLGVGL